MTRTIKLKFDGECVDCGRELIGGQDFGRWIGRGRVTCSDDDPEGCRDSAGSNAIESAPPRTMMDPNTGEKHPVIPVPKATRFATKQSASVRPIDTNTINNGDDKPISKKHIELSPGANFANYTDEELLSMIARASAELIARKMTENSRQAG